MPEQKKGKAMYAQGRLKVGQMNASESAFSAMLELKKHSGEVLWYHFEGVKLRLADNTFYTPDFAVMSTDGVLEMHEVKGFWMDDAKVKIKVASSLYPFRFFAHIIKSNKKRGYYIDKTEEY